MADTDVVTKEGKTSDLEKTVTEGIVDSTKATEEPFITELEGKRAVKPWQDPKTHTPEPGMPRWEEIYKAAKEGERAKQELDELKTSIKDKDKLFDELKAHNKKLMEVMERGVTSIADSVSGKGSENEAAKLENELKELKEQKKQALKDVDYDLVVDLDDKIAEAKDKLKASKAPPETPSKSYQPSSDEQTIVSTFIEKTPWYNEDPLMQAAAVRLDAMLAQQSAWQDKGLKARLDHVRKEIEKKFNYTDGKTGGEPPKPGASAVDYSTAGPSHGKGTSKLSPEQEMVARGLGISNEDYLKQVQLTERGL